PSFFIPHAACRGRLRYGLPTRARATVDPTAMQRTAILLCAIATSVAVLLCPVSSSAQAASPLGGVWALNRALSTVPREIGFNISPPLGGDGGSTSGSGSSGGRGRRGSGGSSGRSGGAVPVVRESYLDGQRLRLAT